MYLLQHLVRVVEVGQHRLDISFIRRPVGHKAPDFPLDALHGGGEQLQQQLQGIKLMGSERIWAE
jgi:hypothetical protein